MKKFLAGGLAVLFAILLSGMMFGSGQAYAFSDEGLNGPAISPGSGVAYYETLSNGRANEAMNGESDGPIISFDPTGYLPSVAFDSTLAGNSMYAAAGETSRWPIISLDPESGGYGEHTYDISSLSGRVVSVDPLSKALIVKSAGGNLTSPEMKEGEAKISADDMTSIRTCDMATEFDHLKVGEKVDIRYHNLNGKLVADEIRVVKAC